MDKHTSDTLDRLFDAITKLESKQECSLFFEDMCTIQELNSFAQRLEVAELLYQGKSYNEVNRLTGVSTATICRVGKCINYGAGGYQLIIDRLDSKEQK